LIRANARAVLRLTGRSSCLLSLALTACEAGETTPGPGRVHDATALCAAPLSLSLPPGTTSLAFDGEGRLWVTWDRGLVIAQGSGMNAAPLELELELELQQPLRLLGSMAGRMHVRTATEVATLDDGGQVRMRSAVAPGELFARDPLGRHLYVATDLGAVLGLDPRLLRPIWGWPRLGAPTTAMAANELGDRLYLALCGGPADSARVVERDVQTGRVRSELFLAEPVLALAAGSPGWLFGLVAADGHSWVLGFRAAGGEMRLAWRRSIGPAEAAGALHLAASAEAPWVAVFGAGSPGGVLVLDEGTGTPLGQWRVSTRDLGFGPNGWAYLLGDGEVWVIRSTAEGNADRKRQSSISEHPSLLPCPSGPE
jgi:hypothetical protein